MQNFITLGQHLLGEKYVAQKERKRKKSNNTKYSGHFFPQQRPRAAQALHSDQFHLNQIKYHPSNLDLENIILNTTLLSL